VVGSEVARLIIGQAADLRARVGRPLELVGIAVRQPDRERVGIDSELLTTDTEALVIREDVDLVIEVIGGIEPARSLILAAMRHGASVVTANKELLAADGAALFEAAEQAGADLYFEAAVAGAIPIIRPLRESLVGDEITSVIGIVNGTTNYILTGWTLAGISFAEALHEAQQFGLRGSGIRRQMLRASTPRPRQRYWRAWRFTPGSRARMFIGRASRALPG
jgi:homoserine dehydrogenase